MRAKYQRWTDERVASLKKRIADGLTYQELSVEFTVSKVALKAIIHKRSIPHPSRARKWTREKIELIKNLQLNSKKNPEIARILGVTTDILENVIRRYKLSRKRPPTNWTSNPSYRSTIERMFKEGKCNAEIGSVLGIAASYVPKVARRLGIARTKEDIRKVTQKMREVYASTYRFDKFRKLRTELSPIRNSFEIGYLVGAFRAANKCGSKHSLYYYTTYIPIAQRVANILSSVVGRKIYYRKRTYPYEKYCSFVVKYKGRALATYLSMFIEKLKKCFPRRLGRLGMAQFSDALYKVQKNYYRFPFDQPPHRKRRDRGWRFEKRWWPKIKKSFARGFVQGVWDARGEVHFGKEGMPALIVRVAEPYIAEYLIWAQRKVGVKKGSINIRRQKRKRGVWYRHYTILLKGKKSILSFAQNFHFPDTRRIRLLKKAVEIVTKM